MADAVKIIRMRDIRRAGMCRDAKVWFEENGLDYDLFLKGRYTLEFAETIDDEMVRQVCAVARARYAEIDNAVT